MIATIFYKRFSLKVRSLKVVLRCSLFDCWFIPEFIPAFTVVGFYRFFFVIVSVANLNLTKKVSLDNGRLLRLRLLQQGDIMVSNAEVSCDEEFPEKNASTVSAYNKMSQLFIIILRKEGDIAQWQSLGNSHFFVIYLYWRNNSSRNNIMTEFCSDLSWA